MIKKLENKRLLCITGMCVVCNSLITVFIAFLLEALVNTANQGDMKMLIKNFAIIGIYLIVAFLITRISSALSNEYIAKQNVVLREFLLSQFLKKPIGDFQKIGVGKALAILENDVALLESNYYRAKLRLVSLCSTFLFGLGAMFMINWRIALVVIATSLLPVLFSSVYSGRLHSLQNLYSESYAHYMTALKNTLTNYGLIKAFHIEEKVQTDVLEQCNRQEQDKKVYQTRTELTEEYTSLVGVFVIIAVFGVGTVLVMRGEAQIGSLLAFIQLTNYVLSPIEGISIQLGRINSCCEIIHKMELIVQEQHAEATVTFPEKFDVRLTNVSYSYGEKEVLRNITLTLEKGKRYVIIGSNGSGKSTLLRIVSRFYENYSGDVLYGNVEAREIQPVSFYQNVILLQQDALILKDTIKNNILLYSDSIDEKKLSIILQSLNLEEMYANGAMCLDNGDNLSGGEKQRIAAARALLREPKVLLLDESFSALDPTMREMMETALLPSAEIVVAISHDRSVENLRKYDEVIYVDDGEIVAKGHVDELIKVLALKK